MTDALLMTDLALRFGAIGAEVLLCLTLLLRRNMPDGALALSALTVTAAAYLVVSAPNSMGLTGMPLAITCVVVSFIPLATAFAVFSLLAPTCTLRLHGLALASASVVAWNLVPIWPVFDPIGASLKLLLFGGIFIVSIRADGDDLVPRRRRFRRICTAMMGALGILGVAMHVLENPAGLPMWVYLLQSASFAAVILCFASQTLSPDADLWPEPTPKPTKPTGDGTRVEALMRDGIWRREGLTVAQMAQELEMPEHRLRQVINQDLGQRNFSGFINAARVQSACISLADPGQARRTVLEIAYEVGFASLGPFNRAFKEQTGLTPTAFRAQARDERDNVTALPISKIPVKSA